MTSVGKTVIINSGIRAVEMDFRFLKVFFTFVGADARELRRQRRRGVGCGPCGQGRSQYLLLNLVILDNPSCLSGRVLNERSCFAFPHQSPCLDVITHYYTAS